MIKIIHITPHFGTGVGTVVRSYARYNNKKKNKFLHEYLILEDLNNPTKNFFKKNRIKYSDEVFYKKKNILKKIKNADIILIHWWNHPLLMYIIARWNIPKSRIIFWCHITGQISPNSFTKQIINFPDKFVFTTPLSKKTLVYKKLSSNLKKKCEVIWSTGGVERVKIYPKKDVKKTIIGYIGNLDFTKLHPDFIKLCEKSYKKNYLFLVVGKIVNNSLKKMILNSKIKKNIKLTGYVSENTKWKLLNSFDVFGYPLARHHYGSCDQSIQEAMAAKIPVVVLNNGMEQYMVSNNITGFVAKNENEYIKTIKNFNKINRKKINQIKQNAYNFAHENYSIKNMSKNWEEIFYEVLKKNKTKKKYSNNILSISEIYQSTLNNQSNIVIKFLKKKKLNNTDTKKLMNFCKNKNWVSPTKSTPFHYQKFFKDSSRLNELCDFLKSNCLVSFN